MGQISLSTLRCLRKCPPPPFSECEESLLELADTDRASRAPLSPVVESASKPQGLQQERLDIQCLGQESLELWKFHFAPKNVDSKVIQVPLDLVNFLIRAFLSPEKFDWANGCIFSQMWDIIIQGSCSKIMAPFVVPDPCIFNHAPTCK